MQKVNFIIPIFLITVVVLSSCGTQEAKPEAKIEQPAVTATVAVEKPVISAGADTPGEAVKSWMDNLHQCNIAKAYSYIEDGADQLARKRAEIKKSLDVASGIYDASKAIVSES